LVLKEIYPHGNDTLRDVLGRPLNDDQPPPEHHHPIQEMIPATVPLPEEELLTYHLSGHQDNLIDLKDLTDHVTRHHHHGKMEVIFQYHNHLTQEDPLHSSSQECKD
jgi:hypothetical protein